MTGRWMFLGEFLFFDFAVLGWGFYELYSLRKSRGGSTAPPETTNVEPPGGSERAGHAEGQHRPHDGG